MSPRITTAYHTIIQCFRDMAMEPWQGLSAVTMNEEKGLKSLGDDEAIYNLY